MTSRLEEYEICKQRKHQASGQIIGDENGHWNICKFCGTHYRHITRIEEANVPTA